MQETVRRPTKLRAALVLAAGVNFFLWGVQGIIASDLIANAWGIQLPDERIFVRLIGAFALVTGVLYYLASKDPYGNKRAVKIGILHHAILTGVLIFDMMRMSAAEYLSIPTSVHLFWLGNLLLCAFMTIALYSLFPRGVADSHV